jgi:hypothetical protein
LYIGEVVHHIDEDIHNNNPENLEVLGSQVDHAREHFTGSVQSQEHVAKRMASKRKTLKRLGRKR